MEATSLMSVYMAVADTILFGCTPQSLWNSPSMNELSSGT